MFAIIYCNKLLLLFLKTSFPQYSRNGIAVFVQQEERFSGGETLFLLNKSMLLKIQEETDIRGEHRFILLLIIIVI